jgi:serine phosphatase RsbU (regulator of sigma subunit)
VQQNRELAPTELLSCLLGTVEQFSAGRAQGDDLTVLVLRYSGVAAS